jgi:hypothetical protein
MTSTVALGLVEAELSRTDTTVHINVAMSPEERDLLNRLAHDNGWTQRQVITIAMKALDALVEEAKPSI